MSAVMLTTIDNPFNPFTQFDEWFAYDSYKMYNTCSYLARIVVGSDSLSDADQDRAVELAIDEIVEIDLLGNYVKVTKENFNDVVLNHIEQVNTD